MAVSCVFYNVLRGRATHGLAFLLALELLELPAHRSRIAIEESGNLGG